MHLFKEATLTTVDGIPLLPSDKMAERAREVLMGTFKWYRNFIDKARAVLTVLYYSLLESGDYSDFVITCGSDTYNVHKSVVCARSEFFKRAERFGLVSSKAIKGGNILFVNGWRFDTSCSLCSSTQIAVKRQSTDTFCRKAQMPR